MSITDNIRQLSRPLEAIPTETEVHCEPISDIRAVLFDVYGTLLISASGDISLTSGASRGNAVGEALGAIGVAFTGSGEQAVELLHEEIKRCHAASEAPYPEVEIRQVWDRVLQLFVANGWIHVDPKEMKVDRLAIEYEMRVNPVWPMPGMEETLSAIRTAQLPLGIVSNAQFFTPELFPAFTGQNLRELGFDSDLCVWSYEHRHAKPGEHLYNVAATALAVQEITPSEVLYIGNDMRNDIAPANQVGFQTVLFAGDARSLRLREDDPLARGVTPDAVVTDLRQILPLLQLAGA